MLSRVTFNGAAWNTFVVYTAAAAAGTSHTIAPRSLRGVFFQAAMQSAGPEAFWSGNASLRRNAK
ncbi:hypothetical protein HMSSN036_24280 [Paenibacillus macerans]|nr:hypothetical protein HMSSN036_24280 [Paenibacillus macerans]